jgi:15-cis-phytoene synthase
MRAFLASLASLRAHTRSAINPDTALAPDKSTFAPGLRLLPAELRRDARSLYQVLRELDDWVDEKHPDAAQHVDAVERWALGEEVDNRQTRMLAELTRRYPLSRSALADFCKGMRLDLVGARMETEEDLERYCQYAGGTVGTMLAGLLGMSDPSGEQLMGALGRALQRTNILRDIDEDLANGRVYIAQTTIERFGFPSPGSRAELMREQIGRAEALYEQGLGAIPLLRRGHRAMSLSVALYREILRQIERDGFGASPGRVVVPRWRMRALTVKHRVLPPRR